MSNDGSLLLETLPASTNNCKFFIALVLKAGLLTGMIDSVDNFPF